MVLVDLAVDSGAINRAAIARDIFGSMVGLSGNLFLERVSLLRVVLYRSYGSLYLGGIRFVTWHAFGVPLSL